MLSSQPVSQKEVSAFSSKILIIIGFIIGLAFIYSISQILIILAFALFLNLLFSPFLNYMNRQRVGDAVGMLIIYLLLILFIVLAFFSVMPIFITQSVFLFGKLSGFVNGLIVSYEANGLSGIGIPVFLQGLFDSIDVKELLNGVQNNLKDIGVFIAQNLKNFLSSGAGIVFKIGNLVFHFILVLIFAFFIAIERHDIRSFFYAVMPDKLSAYIHSKEDEIVSTLSRWLKGQLILALSILVLTFIGLLIVRLFGIKLNGIFTLALIAGMMEFIPYLGPILSLLPAVALALAFGLKGIIVIVVLYIIIQQTENNLLVPIIMSRTLSISPFAVLLAMSIGASIFGIAGIIVAVPITCILQIFIRDYLKKNQTVEKLDKKTKSQTK